MAHTRSGSLEKRPAVSSPGSRLENTTAAAVPAGSTIPVGVADEVRLGREDLGIAKGQHVVISPAGYGAACSTFTAPA